MTFASRVRSFNRFYTRKIGLLDKHLPGSALSLPEARVLYEIAQSHGPGPTAADLCRALAMDKAHMSRVVARLRSKKYVRGVVSAANARRLRLALTLTGKEAFASVDRGAQQQIEAMIGPLDAAAKARLIGAMNDIRAVLRDDLDRDRTPRLRGLRPGDLGWIVNRQAEIYFQEYRWDWTYEGLVCRILGDFVANFDPTKEDHWVGELAGAVVGSVFLMKGDEPHSAKLRLLYVEPWARGVGVGRVLVDACVARARELGYRELTLWTNDVLVAARRLYQSTGFRLVSRNPHRSFGHDLVGETWRLDLQPDLRTAGA